MISQTLKKSRSNENYSTTFTTGDTVRTERILVKRIPLSTYFGNEPGEFYKKYSMRGDINIKLDITLLNSNIATEKTEYLYESDGAALSSRNPKYEDVVLVYVTIKIPVRNGTIETSQGYYHMDFNPTQGHKHSVAYDNFEKFVPSHVSETNIVKLEADNRELLARPMNIYLRPTKIRDKRNNNAVIADTARTTVLYHTDQDFWFDSQDLRYDPTMLRLGKVVVHANSSVDDNMTILDTRTRGGGLDESLSRKVIKDVNSESLFNWDIGYFDGEAYQENGVMIIKLPTTLKDKYGENYQSLVQEAVAKHKAYGVLPIIEYYDPEEINTGRFALLPNHNFLNGEHISYHDPKLSTYSLISNTPEGYLVEIPATRQYAFKIPSYRLEDVGQLRIRPYIKRQSTTQSLIGKVAIHYKHAVTGYSKKEINLNADHVANTNWTELDFIIDLYGGLTADMMREIEILYVDVIFIGPMMVDYVSVKAHDGYNYSEMEVIEL